MLSLAFAALCFWAASVSPKPWNYINFGFGVLQLIRFLG